MGPGDCTDPTDDAWVPGGAALERARPPALGWSQEARKSEGEGRSNWMLRRVMSKTSQGAITTKGEEHGPGGEGGSFPTHYIDHCFLRVCGGCRANDRELGRADSAHPHRLRGHHRGIGPVPVLFPLTSPTRIAQPPLPTTSPSCRRPASTSARGEAADRITSGTFCPPAQSAI
jgi:hypothetical protein